MFRVLRDLTRHFPYTCTP